MKKIVLLGFILLSLTHCKHVQVNIPADFVETEIPVAFSEDWAILNHSPNDFRVNNVNNELTIEKIKARNNAELQLDQGTLIGESKGEWNGKLIFKSNTKDNKEIEIKKGNIKFLFNFKGKIYFIEALSHLTYTGGAIYELKQDGNQFTYEKRLEFKDSPEAFTVYDDVFLIATHQNFYVVEDFKSKLIFRNTFWSSLYPNSLAVFDNEHVIMGIRGGIVKLNLIDKDMTFYKYTE